MSYSDFRPGDILSGLKDIGRGLLWLLKWAGIITGVLLVGGLVILGAWMLYNWQEANLAAANRIGLAVLAAFAIWPLWEIRRLLAMIVKQNEALLRLRRPDLYD